MIGFYSGYCTMFLVKLFMDRQQIYEIIQWKLMKQSWYKKLKDPIQDEYIYI
jgi:hypothetical protein